MNRILFLLLFIPAGLFAQTPPLFVADQTFRLEGVSEYLYAFAEGDQVQLYVQELTGKKIRAVEFSEYPDYPLFRAYDLDSVLTKTITIPKTGIYLLRFQEVGMNKKICRFTLHRTAAGPESARMNTRVGWDIRENPQFRVGKRSVQTGKKTEVMSLGGQVTVAASKFFTKKPVNAYQFTLPPNTLQWAYRISVGQAVTEARRQDADKLKSMLQSGAVKIMGIQPQTALAAFALGMAIDMTVTTGGEDVDYALVDWNNWQQFAKNENYNAYMQQTGMSVDVQRRYSPLEGTFFFALRSDNWVDDITITIDIEAVTEIPLFETEIFLEPYKE